MRLIVVVGVLVAVLVLALLSFTPPHLQHPNSLTGGRKAVILAHRGSRTLQPENTILAFQNALDFGADVLETDVQLTRDQQLVIFHDDTVDRVTNGHGRVSQHTLAEMQQLDAGYKFTHDNGTTFPFRGKGIKLSSPDEIFKKFPTAYFNIELKNPDTLAAELLYKVISENNMQQRVAVGGRWCTSVRHFREVSAKDNIQTSACEGEVIWFLLHSYLRTCAAWYTFVDHLAPQSLQVPTSSGPFKIDTAVVLSSMKMFGKHVHYWVINDPDEIRRLISLGADGVITDRPDLAVEVFESMGIQPKVKREIHQYRDERYFVPVDTHVEIHTCVGLICIVLQHFEASVAIFVATIVLFVVLLKGMLRKKTKQA